MPEDAEQQVITDSEQEEEKEPAKQTPQSPPPKLVGEKRKRVPAKF